MNLRNNAVYFLILTPHCTGKGENLIYIVKKAFTTKYGFGPSKCSEELKFEKLHFISQIYHGNKSY